MSSKNKTGLLLAELAKNPVKPLVIGQDTITSLRRSSDKAGDASRGPSVSSGPTVSSADLDTIEDAINRWSRTSLCQSL